MTINNAYEQIDAARALILFESLVSELDANTLQMDYIIQNPECVDPLLAKSSRRHRRKAKLYLLLDKFGCLKLTKPSVVVVVKLTVSLTTVNVLHRTIDNSEALSVSSDD